MAAVQHTPDLPTDTDRPRRILRAVADAPLRVGDIHRAVRRPEEPCRMAKYRTLAVVRGLVAQRRLHWRPGGYVASPDGLAHLFALEASR